MESDYLVLQIYSVMTIEAIQWLTLLRNCCSSNIMSSLKKIVN